MYMLYVVQENMRDVCPGAVTAGWTTGTGERASSASRQSYRGTSHRRDTGWTAWAGEGMVWEGESRG